MTLSLDTIEPAVAVLFALAAIALVAGAGEQRRTAQILGALLLLLGAAALLATAALPQLLPARSAIVHRDGSSEDPRVLATLVAALATLAALLPAWRSLRLAVLAAVGAALPGLAVAGLLGAVATFEGLRQPMPLAGIALGGFVIGTSVMLALRARDLPGRLPLLTQACATGVLVVCVMLSLHGARAAGVSVSEDAPADTLEHHISLVSVESPDSSRHVMTVALQSAGDSLRLHPTLAGAPGSDMRSLADARLLSGPIVVPLALQERRQNPHELQWMDKKTPLQIAGATLKFTGFRIEQTDSIRMFADLEVTTASGTQKVSPGMIATQHGEIPFAAMAKGFGPIAAVAFDADNGRVGLMLPQLTNSATSHRALLDVRLRPALPAAWMAALCAALAFLAGLVPVRQTRRSM